MNCKPGDLAIIVSDKSEFPPMCGHIVSVMNLAPWRPFTDPDGNGHVAADSDSWLVKLQRPLLWPTYPSGYARTIYIVCNDSQLRPIRPDSLADETEREKEIAA
jgi:hypothetical protein